ncbi:MAG: F0F1 ATP synthase subunit A, partial [Bacteroidota bacterium]
MFAFLDSAEDTVHAPHNAADTLHAVAGHGGTHGDDAGGNLFTELLRHVQDSHELELPFIGHIGLPHFEPVHLAGLTIDFSITKHVVFLWVAAAILIIVAINAARQNQRNRIPRGFGNLMEVFVQFIRDEIVIPNMGPKGAKYMPYLLTTFFYILIMNLLGLIPYGASAPGNVSVTAGLAIIAFIM